MITENHDVKWVSVKREIYSRIGDTENLVRAVFSGQRRNFKMEYDRIDVKPVLIKENLLLHIQFTDENQRITKNLTFQEFSELNILESGFANFLIESRSESLQVRLGKKGQVFEKRSRVNLIPDYDHDRKKLRLLEENNPYFIAVGISDSSGRVKPSMRDKYLQVEEFLKILDSSSKPFIDSKKKVRIVDLGCGHAYLTFAAVSFFQQKDQPIEFVGVDIRTKTRERNEEIARELNLSEKVSFYASEIAEFPVRPTDIVIALHACDTATDDALAWAVKSEAQLILVAPCCHKDVHRQVKKTPALLKNIFHHGILGVRQLDLLTDALRAQILQIVGYKTDVFEFISGDHTARNLMIRGSRAGWQLQKAKVDKEQLREYHHILAQWGVKPALGKRLELGTDTASD